ncbi:MAG: adenylyl-sulfate kinase [Solirubrobacteraceae bacterium]
MNAGQPLQLLVRDATGVARPEVMQRLRSGREVIVTGPGREVIVTGPEDPDTSLRAIATGALRPDVSVIVVDARFGPVTATRREAYLMSLLGVGAAAFAIVEPPVAQADEERYHTVARECAQLARRVGLGPVTCFPVTAREGWFGGLPLPEFLDGLAGAPRTSSVVGAPELPETDQVRATIIWTHPSPLLRGRTYTLRTETEEVTATVAPIKHRLDLDTLEPVPATRLEGGQIGDCDLELGGPIAAAPYRARGGHGAFILVDPLSDEPAGLGLVRFALRRAQNLRWQSVSVDGASRAARLGQTPCVLWLTGLSGAGKSTIANQVETDLQARGRHTYLLDGDNVRHGLNRDLGFTDADRVENIRRVGEVAKLMVDAGLIVIVSFISPFRSEREMARSLFKPGRFFEVYVDTPLEVAEQRDPKGLYRKARRGELRNFTGIDSAYEPPETPDLQLPTTVRSVRQSSHDVLAMLVARGILAPD